jgi:hypothetical protein
MYYYYEYDSCTLSYKNNNCFTGLELRPVKIIDKKAFFMVIFLVEFPYMGTELPI